MSTRSAWGVSTGRSIPAHMRTTGLLRGGRMNNGENVGFKLTIDGENSDLALAFQGRLQASIDEQYRALERIYWAAMDVVVQDGKNRLRADVVAGGFHKGAALSKTWRGNTYPKDKDSLNVAGWIYTRAGLIIDAFSMSTVIKVSGNAQFLAIPTGPAKAIVRRLQQQKKRGVVGRNAFGKFMKDDSYADQVAMMLGVDLVPIIAPDRQTGVLIAKDRSTLTPTGRLARNQNRRATVLFALTKTATLKKRVEGRALLEKIEAGFPGGFAQALTTLLPADLRSDR
ncbi:hypothetical protein KOAAANKH_00100 [Brevundimonas sp. NIBR10]|uniref:DUF6441 family protein n=1 Tax=Brevundimonas sp. NIBR10 TaxID=3015997 RepID=UPI0022F1517C|nr:DUF6441 family protein [Brevundimonas sp. NIBR10]WGM45239.1 hypothetical protein KOAAANKH_00100 [Brevundimonas sp. NIBR10]